MMERDLSLTPRAEAVRDARPVVVPVHFSLNDILNHFKESMCNIKAQFSIADSLLDNENELGCKMIWRSQVVLAESLLDFFIHEMSKYCLFRMYTGQWEKTSKYENFMLPMSIVENAINSINSDEWFFEYLNMRFSRDVYLSAECMKDQLNMLGIGFVPVVVEAFPRDKEDTSKKDGTEIIQELFQRRNEIVHQNDRSHSTAEQSDISKEYVVDYLDKVEHIVYAIWNIAIKKDSSYDRN